MVPIHSSWKLGTWWKVDGEPERLSPSLVADLTAKIAHSADDQRVVVTAGMLRALLAAHERTEQTRGAEIVDPERRVTYRATVGRGEGRAWLRTVEVIPHDEEPDPKVFRVPVQAVADMTALILAQQGESDSVFIMGETPPREGQPDAEQLAALLHQGETRRTLAARFDKSVSRVDDWLRLARRERPDLDWPARRRGPKPQTTDTAPSRTKRG